MDEEKDDFDPEPDRKYFSRRPLSKETDQPGIHLRPSPKKERAPPPPRDSKAEASVNIPKRISPRQTQSEEKSTRKSGRRSIRRSSSGSERRSSGLARLKRDIINTGIERMKARAQKFVRPDDIPMWLKICTLLFSLLILVLAIAMVFVGLWHISDSQDSFFRSKSGKAFQKMHQLGVFLISVGCYLFFIFPLGCVAVLRQNIPLLFLHSFLMVLAICGELVAAGMGLSIPESFRRMMRQFLRKDYILDYGTDPRITDVMDHIQQEFKCCGFTRFSYMDWNYNALYNCSGEGEFKCSLPFSCCRNPYEFSPGLPNTMCAERVLVLPKAEAENFVFTQGCVEAIDNAKHHNLLVPGILALHVAVFQCVYLYLAQRLHRKICQVRSHFVFLQAEEARLVAVGQQPTYWSNERSVFYEKPE